MKHVFCKLQNEYHCRLRCAQIKENAGWMTQGSDAVVGVGKFSSYSKHELVGSQSLEWLRDDYRWVWIPCGTHCIQHGVVHKTTFFLNSQVLEKNQKAHWKKVAKMQYMQGHCCRYLAHKFEESCHDSNGAACLFGMSDSVHFATLQNRRPFVHCPLQRPALLLK